MSGGVSAIKGFDYQAAVILDRLFAHFDNHPFTAQARPEGLDDLDLSWIDGGTEFRQYIQIKKPTEDLSGSLNPTPWKLSTTVKELLPGAIAHLSGNNHSQLWIVGDRFDDEVIALIDACEKAPVTVPQTYWNVIHRLALNEAFTKHRIERGIRKNLVHWKAPPFIVADLESTKSELITQFSHFSKNLCVSAELSNWYAARVSKLHTCLPGILARIQIQATYGSEQEVIQRVYNRLEERYSLSQTVIANTLFRNLRGFINDIAKQPGRSFNKAEFEFEMRSVWPQMISVKAVPELEPDHIPRRDLVEQFTKKWTGKAIEVVGISGSGKTTLAAEIAERYRIVSPDRLVFYAEIRLDDNLRDVLAGIAFHIRRQNIHEPFAIATNYERANEDVVSAFARAYSKVPHDTLVLIDLVDGCCAPSFSRDLATFMRALSSPSFQIVVFGQESALRELTSMERDELGILRIDIRGFKFDEFVKLVKHYHASPDFTVLSNIYDRVTAGRASGLFARLALVLARASTIQDMVLIASRPVEEMLAWAEQQRFFQISRGARSAAEKMVCFALPFRRNEAEEIFPDENIGAGIRELLAQGLLRYHDNDVFEMHETVRAGLEEMLAVNVRHTSHQSLAAWYRAQGLLTTEIFHLGKAGKGLEANERAREIFLRGDQWPAIAPYILRHNLVSAKEVTEMLAGPHTIEHIFMLGNILNHLRTPTLVSELTAIITDQKQRFFSDYKWGSAIAETILQFEPAQLHHLIVFSITNAQNERQVGVSLGWLALAIQRRGGIVTSETIEFFNTQPLEIQEILTGLLLQDKRRHTLHTAITFLNSHPQVCKEKNNYTLRINSLNEASEFLAALPRAHIVDMLIARSVLLGPISCLIWSQRAKLRVFCISVLEERTSEEIVIENALRVLIFLAEPSLHVLCKPLRNRSEIIRSFATIYPVLQPTLLEHRRCEATLFNCHAALDERLTALLILAYLGADLSSLYHALEIIESVAARWRVWELTFLMVAGQNPFPEAIALLDEQLNFGKSEQYRLLILPLLKTGQLPGPESTAMLTRALTHPNPAIRRSAVVSFTRKRTRSALPALIEHYAQEEEELSVANLAGAIVASGAKSLLALAGHDTVSGVQIWKCVLAMRSRDIASADWIVSIAVEPAHHWKLRRMAIYAAGRLPFSAALERLLPVVMGEHSPFTLDNSENLGYHALISSLLTSGPHWCDYVRKGRAIFVEYFAGILVDVSSGWLINHDLPSSVEAADWLYDRLSFHGWPVKNNALIRIINELHIPLLQSAAIRALRLCGQTDLIEQHLSVADNIWTARKCLSERRRAGNFDAELKTRLISIVEASPWKGNTLLLGSIRDVSYTPELLPKERSVMPILSTSQVSAMPITYTDAINALSGAVINFNTHSPVVFERISSAQCQHLISLAAPTNDPHYGVETYIPMIQFTSDSHLVSQQQWTSSNSDASPHSRIRPAIVAANRFRLPIPWLDELMTSPWSDRFVKNYLMCLSVLDDSEQFYEALSKYEDVIIVYLCDKNKNGPVRKFIDDRIIPTLMRYVPSGTDEIFEGLCMLTHLISTPGIEPVLHGLIHRWAQHFEKKIDISKHNTNSYLWQGFRILTEHPRFTYIRDWVDILEKVLHTSIDRFHAQDILRVLELSPSSYMLIESRLFMEENWDHFKQEEIDRLDDAADRMFQQTSE